MSYEPKIILHGAPNARDLGGIETADGRVVKKNRIIRSGMLRNITDEDVKYLKSADLRTVVDFRTEQERIQKPDRIIEGVDYICCPLLERKTDGITRDKPETEEEEARRTVAMAQKLMSRNRDGRAQMKSLYPVLVSEDLPVNGLKKFFKVMLTQEKGAVLYHCTMGKDRVGTATALLLSALNVPRETIVRDYMITLERCRPGTERLLSNCKKYTDDKEILEFVYLLDIVEEDFIGAVFETAEAQCGSMKNYLRDRIGLGENDLARLRAMYTE